ncbi:MAG: Omp28-related outer membrane protein [Muribaculaceae bacterium]|nr:Omp28-related outer membrane protein [Muribaculaceae bacterium]
MIRKIFFFLSLLFVLPGAYSSLRAQDSDLIYPRKVVVEEWTGLWCGMCPSGIVGMEYMEDTYGEENFIGIAVHCDDRLESPAYKDFIRDFIVTSFPGSVINRSRVVNPDKQLLEAHYKSIVEQNTFAKVEVSAETPYSYDKEMEVTATVTFSRQLDNASYKLAFILTENNVGPYMQTNTYGSGFLGPLDGWEKKGSYVPYHFSHVLRDAVGCLGIEGSVPSLIEPSVEYGYSATVPLDRLADINNSTLIALLIDGKTREIINADKLALQTVDQPEPEDPEDPENSGVTSIAGDPSRLPITLVSGGFVAGTDVCSGYVYSTDGRLVQNFAGGQHVSLTGGLYVVVVSDLDGTRCSYKLAIP